MKVNIDIQVDSQEDDEVIVIMKHKKFFKQVDPQKFLKQAMEKAVEKLDDEGHKLNLS